MSRRIEKRTKRIPPCTIDKKLLLNVGKIIEESTPEGNHFYKIDSHSSEIESGSIDSFVKAEWPEKITNIRMEAKWKNRAKLNLGINFTSNTFGNTIELSGEDPIWVEGVSNHIEQEFMKRKFWYWWLQEYKIIRFLVATVSWVSMFYALDWMLNIKILPMFRLQWSNLFEMSLILGIFLIPTYFSEFLIWLFPRYEYGKQFPQRNIRSLIMAIITSSGILSWLIQQFLQSTPS